MLQLRILYGKRILCVDVELTDTILGVKTKIEHEVKAQALRQRLSCNGTNMVNSSTVGEYGLHTDSTVHCSIDGEITVYMQEVDGNRIPVMIDPYTNGLKLKHELLFNQDKYFQNKGYKELKEVMQKHYHAGAEIKPFMTLPEQGVFGDSTVDFFFMKKSNMTLTVDTYTGKEFVLPNLTSDTNIWQLKKKLSKVCGISVDKQVLVFKGQRFGSFGGIETGCALMKKDQGKTH